MHFALVQLQWLVLVTEPIYTPSLGSIADAKVVDTREKVRHLREAPNDQSAKVINPRHLGPVWLVATKKLPWVLFRLQIFAIGHCSTFHLYLTNFVRSWTN